MTKARNQPSTRTAAVPAFQLAPYALGDVLAVIIGAASAIEVRLVGLLYFGEVALAVAALALPIALRRMEGGRARRWIVGFLVISAGYLSALVATDLHLGTPVADYARGWVRAILLITNVAGLIALAWDRRIRLVYWLVGLGAAAGLVALVSGGLTVLNWKVGLALPVTILLLSAMDARRTRVLYPGLGGLAVLDLLLDYRSLAAFSLCTLLLVLLKKRRGRLLDPVFVASSLVGVGAFAGLYLGNVGVTQAGYALAERRIESNVGRYAGLATGLDLISQSPIVGYGSWPKNAEAFSAWAELQAQLDSELSAQDVITEAREAGTEDLVVTHSQVLQGWVEAGLPGAIFFVLLFIGSARCLWLNVRRPDVPPEIALVIFWGLWTLWALLLSPFSGFVRLHNAIGLVLPFAYAFDLGVPSRSRRIPGELR